MSHVTHMNESCHTYEWVISHTWMSHVTHMNKSCHTYKWVMSHIWISHVTHMNQSRHTYEWVISHIRMSNVAHLMSHVTHAMSHVIHDEQIACPFYRARWGARACIRISPATESCHTYDTRITRMPSHVTCLTGVWGAPESWHLIPASHWDRWRHRRRGTARLLRGTMQSAAASGCCNESCHTCVEPCMGHVTRVTSHVICHSWHDTHTTHHT